MGDFNVEITLFNILGYSLLFGAAAIVLVPALVWVGNFICACLWRFIDEGETDYKNKFTSTYLMQEDPCQIEVVEEEYGYPFANKKAWFIKLTGKGYGTELKEMYVQRPNHRLYHRLDGNGAFDTKELAEEFLESYPATIKTLARNEFRIGYVPANHTYLIPILAPLGLGFLHIPTITLVGGSVMLSLYAMRWARRGVKLAKKVKGSLENHIADKDAHRE